MAIVPEKVLLVPITMPDTHVIFRQMSRAWTLPTSPNPKAGLSVDTVSPGPNRVKPGGRRSPGGPVGREVATNRVPPTLVMTKASARASTPQSESRPTKAISNLLKLNTSNLLGLERQVARVSMREPVRPVEVGWRWLAQLLVGRPAIENLSF
jgi:hypothetical protein